MKTNCHYKFSFWSVTIIICILGCFLFIPSFVLGQKDKSDHKEIYTLVDPDFDNVVIRSVHEDASIQGSHDFVAMSYDEENKGLIPGYYLLHVTGDTVEKNRYQPGTI